MRLTAVNVNKAAPPASSIKVTPVGTAVAKTFIAERHGSLHLPRDDIFAFVVSKKATEKTYVIVSEVDERIKIVGGTWHKNLTMTEASFDNLVTLAMHEADVCGVGLPFSLTFANRHGVFIFVADTNEQRRVA